MARPGLEDQCGSSGTSGGVKKIWTGAVAKARKGISPQSSYAAVRVLRYL
ncbi:MAG: hypothetical protein ACR2IV_01620 [Bryobacteraceae bacterium]